MTVSLVNSNPNKPIPADGSVGNIITSDVALMVQTSSTSSSVDLSTLNVTVAYGDSELITPRAVFTAGKIQDNFTGALSQSGSVDKTEKDLTRITFGHSAKFYYNSHITIRVTGKEVGSIFDFTPVVYSFYTTAFSDVFPNATIPATVDTVNRLPQENAPVDKTMSFRLNGSSATPSILELTVSWDSPPYSNNVIHLGSQVLTSEFIASISGNVVQFTRIANNLPYNTIVKVSATFLESLIPYTQDFNFKTVPQPTTLQDMSKDALNDIQSSYTSIKDDGAVTDTVYTNSVIPITITPRGEITDFNVNFTDQAHSGILNSPIRIYYTATTPPKPPRSSTVMAVQTDTLLADPALGKTVTVTNGSTSVTGVGTDFLNQLKSGDTFHFGTDSKTYVIDNVSTSTSLTLAASDPYSGPTATGKAYKQSSTIVINPKGVLFGNATETLDKYVVTTQVVRGANSMKASSPGVSDMSGQTASTTNAIFLAVQNWARSLAGFRHVFTPKNLQPTAMPFIGACTVTNGSPNVLGVGTSFFTQLSTTTNNRVRFGSDPTVYTVTLLGMVDDQNLIMSSNYAGTTLNNVIGYKVSSDWATNPLGEASAVFGIDPTHDSVPVCYFSPAATSQGVGFFVDIPLGANGFELSFKGRPFSVPVNPALVGWTLYYRPISDATTPSAISTWTAITIDDQLIDSPYYKYSNVQTVPLSSTTITPGNLYQFELVRTAPTTIPAVLIPPTPAVLESTYDYLLAELVIDFS